MGIADILSNFPVHLTTMALLLCASAFFSLSETALFSLSREQLRRLRASRSPFHQLAARLVVDPRRLLVTVLLGNVVVNTAFFVASVVLIHRIGELHPLYLGYWKILIAVATPLVLIVFGEVLPKSVGAVVPEWLAPVVSVPLGALEYVITPVRILLVNGLVMPLEWLLTGRRREAPPFVTADELQAIVELAAREGGVSSQESDMIADVLELGDRRVREVMRPRVEIVGCDRVTPMAIVLAVFRRTRLSKMVVYENAMDHIVGVVYAKTAFLAAGQPLAALVRPVYYVPETKTVESLLKDFRARKIQLAVVVDEYGGVSGLVTLEDCLEQIVGRIEDETDRPAAEPVQRLSESEYLLAGDLSIRSWADLFNLDLAPGGRYSTVAGFVTFLLGRLPRPGDVARWRNLEFSVLDVAQRRVARVRVRLIDRDQEPAASATPGATRKDPE
jgi:putative hemolysin